LGILPPGRGGF